MEPSAHDVVSLGQEKKCCRFEPETAELCRTLRVTLGVPVLGTRCSFFVASRHAHGALV
jgi:hypothetical protein